MLYQYAEETQRFIRDSRQQDIDLADIFSHINAARREVAMRAECIVRVPPISGACVSASVISGGSGYTAPTVTISGPDFPSGEPPYPLGLQATANALLVGDTIAAVDIQSGGSGYFQPTATITDPTGTGAEVSVSVSPIFTINQGQEKYNLADIDLSVFPGVESILSIRSISILYSSWRYSLAAYSFSTYQAKIRQFAPSTNYLYVPSFYCQLEQGTDGAILLYPPPSQTYQAEIQAVCLPSDLTTDDSVEAIPMPWRDAVKWYAAALAFMDLQNRNAAREFFDLFDKFMSRYSAAARPGRRSNPYGRW